MVPSAGPGLFDAAAAGFNGFDAVLCDAFPEACLLDGAERFFDLAAAGLADFDARAFVARGERTLADFVTDLPEVLEDFVRVFLDIRLPFVAFGGSTNRVLPGLARAMRIRTGRWASLMASEYGYKDFEALRVPC